MRIGVNASPMSLDTAADTGNIVTTLLTGLCRLHPEHTFVFFFDKTPSSSLKLPSNAAMVVLPLKGDSAWRLSLWQEWTLPRALKAQRIELYLGMDGALPLRSKIPAELFITDMGFMHGVAGMRPSVQRSLQKNTAKYIQKAQRVLVLSQATKDDVLQYAPDAADKVQLVSPGIPESYQPLEWQDREDVKREFAWGVEYFIAVGSLHPRNNILPLLKAFSALKRRLHSNMKLVLAGAGTPAGAEITGSLSSYKYRDDVVLLKDADQATLSRAVAGAYALIYTSRFEGMAMPVYAALQCQVPVIALEGQAAREAGGDAVLYTDPESLEDLADKMCLLYKDEELRTRQLGRIAARPLPVLSVAGFTG
ncbi:glycosyltransferase [Chitinophaga oryziterrae]|uniref:Glycosyltransferase n=1 Tax=Chitinophaga oryziterrae TaxID=1031224 RepID=A0A6N8JFR3_9BACT|nr:glycosyltransferase [Chitinophaga oryziterrae]MVT44103.1 glycosyltransferase [Chitinophaga oryziterrae]